MVAGQVCPAARISRVRDVAGVIFVQEVNMAVYRACYCTREDVQRALDIAPSLIDYARIDRAIQSASEDVDGLCHRRFFASYETKYWDWPNYQYSYPWRIWLDGAELASVTGAYVPVVTTGGTVIPANEIFWKPWNYGPPFYGIELDRSTSAAFGVSATPQRDVAITGWFGYWMDTNPAGDLVVTVNSTTTTLICSNAAVVGVGDVLTVDSEQMLVQDRNWYDTGEMLSTGGSTASAADNTLTFFGGTFYAGEVLMLDSEQMLITVALGVAGSYLVKRAWNGTVLATHNSSEVYAERSLVVTRADYGSTAAAHTALAGLFVNKIPPLVEDLALSESINSVLQETAGYASEVGESGGSQKSTGGDLPALRDQVLTRYGRKNRQRVV